jgi:hypothetical protein
MMTAALDLKIDILRVNLPLLLVCPTCGARATIAPQHGEIVAVYHLCRPDEDRSYRRLPVHMEPLEEVREGEACEELIGRSPPLGNSRWRPWVREMASRSPEASRVRASSTLSAVPNRRSVSASTAK